MFPLCVYSCVYLQSKATMVLSKVYQNLFTVKDGCESGSDYQTRLHIKVPQYNVQKLSYTNTHPSAFISFFPEIHIAKWEVGNNLKQMVAYS